MDITTIAENSNWQIKKISDVTFYQEGPGVRKYQYRTSGVKLLNVANLQNGKMDLTKSERFITEKEAYNKYSHFLVDEGDLIIACSGIKVEYFEKKMGFAKSEHLPLCMNTSTMRFKVLDEDELDIKYLAYYLKTNYFKKQIQRLITGSAQLNFGPSHIRQVDIILPPIQTQNKIVEVLDKAQGLIDLRKKLIELLDQLIQSVFYDMFGDPVMNPKGWKVKTIIDECDCIVPARDKPKSFTGTIPWITINDLNQDGYTTVSKSGWGLTDTEISEVKRKKIPSNSVLMSCVGDLGITSINSVPVVINQQLHSFQCGKNINPFYLRFMIPLNKQYLIKMATSTTVPYLNKSKCNSIPLMLPPIELQNDFDQRVQKIEEQKQLMQQSLTEMENNFNSLMQRAFKGELFI